MRLDFWNSTKEKGLVGLGIIYAQDNPREEKSFLFGLPSEAEARKNSEGLRLIGGMANKGEGTVDALFRELREEILGRTLDNSTPERQQVLRLFEKMRSDLEQNLENLNRFASYHRHETGTVFKFEAKPDRSHPAQKDWIDTTNYVYPIRVSKDELELLRRVAVDTAQRETDQTHELKDAVILSQSDLETRFKRGEKMGYRGEQNALANFISVASGENPRQRRDIYKAFRHN